MNTTGIVGNTTGIVGNGTEIVANVTSLRNLFGRHFPLELDLFLFDTGSPSVFAIVMITLAILGIIGNLLTILTIAMNRKLHSPTFVAIGCLELADLLNLVFYWLFYVTNLPIYLYHVVKITAMPNIVSSFRTFLHYLSAFHILLLSVLRYGLIAQPLQCRNRVTVTVILMTSLVFWMISCLITVAQQIFLTELHDTTARDLQNFLVSQFQYGVSQCLVLLTLIFLHCLKMRVLKNSPSSPRFVRSRMSRVITAVLAVFSVYSVAAVVTAVMEFLFIMEQLSSPIYRTLSLLYNLTLFLNFSSNPYIYFVSFVFMKYWPKLCSRNQ